MFGPVLTGDLVTLRPLRPTEKEAEVMCRWFEDTTVTAWLSRTDPPTAEQELDWIKSKQADPCAIAWGIEFEGRLIGTGGVELIDWRHGHCTLGIVIGDKSIWGKGVASEAGKMVVDDLFSFTELKVLRAGFIDGNRASQQLQAKLGLRECGRWPQAFMRKGQLRDHVNTALTREDWEVMQTAE